MYRPSSAASLVMLSAVRAQGTALCVICRSKCLTNLNLLMILPTRTPITSCPLSLLACTRSWICASRSLVAASSAARLCARSLASAPLRQAH